MSRVRQRPELATSVLARSLLLALGPRSALGGSLAALGLLRSAGSPLAARGLLAAGGLLAARRRLLPTTLGRALLVGLLLVGGAAMVGDVETRSLEEQPRSRGRHAHRASLAARAAPRLLVLHAMEHLETMLALLALIVVRRHLWLRSLAGATWKSRA